jgi:hypothetical protein
VIKPLKIRKANSVESRGYSWALLDTPISPLGILKFDLPCA